METGGKCNQFLQNCDLYAAPINLSYNNKRVYQTSYGGVLTILSGMIIVIWLGMQALKVKKNDFTFTETQSLYSDAQAYNMTPNDFVLAVNVYVTNTTVFPGNMSQYISTVYMQFT